MIAYCRVSTREQGESGAGLQAQRDAINASSHQVTDWFEDVASGKHMRRPGLEQALALCAAGESDGIVVAKLDRLNRSLADFAATMAVARKQGWNLVALDLGVDLSTSAGRLMANVFASMAEWERDVISDRTKDALAVVKAQGTQLGRPRQIPEGSRAFIADLAGEAGLARAWRAIAADPGLCVSRASVYRIAGEHLH